MSLLQSIDLPTQQDGARVIVYANEKMGKTTFAASAPNPIIIPLEIGYAGLDRSKVKITSMVQSYDELLKGLQEFYASMQAGTFPFKSIVFDSGTALEKLIHDKIIVRDKKWVAGNPHAVTMETALGGYGKAHQFSNLEFDNFLKWCDLFAVNFKINIIITCHAFSNKILDPTSGEYDIWDLLLHSPKNLKTYGKREIATQWADIVGYIYEPMFINEGDKMNSATSKKQGRVLGVSRTFSYVAGNRYNIVDAIPLPEENGWNQLANAIYTCKGLDYFNPVT